MFLMCKKIPRGGYHQPTFKKNDKRLFSKENTSRIELQLKQLILESIKTLWFFPYQPYVCFIRYPF